MSSSIHLPTARSARLRAFVEVTTATLDAVAGEGRLAALVVDVIGRTLAAHATVWILPTDGGPMTMLAGDHPGGQEARLAAALRDWLADPAGDTDTVWIDGAALLPMRVRGRLAGAVAVSRPDGEPFTDDDMDFVHALADVTGATFQNARVLADSAEVMEELRQQGELMEHISDALIACDSERRIVNWNAGAERIYGYPQGEALGCDVFALLATRFFTVGGVAVPAEEVFEELANTGQWHGELHERRADGAPLTAMCSLTARGGPLGGDAGIILVNRDVTDQRREEHRALHDALTGLPNRRLLTNRLYDALARRHRTGSALAVLFVDLDKFKPINDTYGHAAGDEVLTVTARRLADVVRHSDTVARLGGDEFVVVLEDAGTQENIRCATRRVVEQLAEPIDLGGTMVEVRASIGVAVVNTPQGGGEIAPETLIGIADEAMYEAKHNHTGIRFTYCSDTSGCSDTSDTQGRVGHC
ncbi:diguanylate cyclase domain-containing protein [Planosporangium sp. 12N6]|uniref:diguanylate cyclase domain-containing protein n=1 Tax=Planosporangium spinosum TaxID=3402278 RepID=UPI003CF7BFFD